MSTLTQHTNSMAQAYPQTVLQNTLRTLAQGEVAPASGADLIRDWQTALKSVDSDTDEISQHLTNLYDELINPTPDVHRVKNHLNLLANHTQVLSKSADTELGQSLSQLADSLRSFATDLNRVGDDSQLAENQEPKDTIYGLFNPADRAQKMFIETQETLAGGVAGVTPEQGSVLVDDWITVVRSDPSSQWIEAPLAQLREALEAGDMRATERLMRDLAGTAQEYANNTPDGPFSKDLTNLATALTSFAGPLS